MKKLALVGCVLAFLAADISAQTYGTTELETKPMTFYLGVGAGLPLGKFNDVYNVGLHALGGVNFNITSVPGLQVAPNIEFHTFALNKDKYLSTFNNGTPGFSVNLGATNIVMVGANGKYNLTGVAPKLSPYLLGGAGAAFLIYGKRDITVPAGWTGSIPGKPDNQTKFFYSAGLGTEFALGNTMRLFVEGRFLGLPTSEVDFNMIPLTVGLRF